DAPYRHQSLAIYGSHTRVDRNCRSVALPLRNQAYFGFCPSDGPWPPGPSHGIGRFVTNVQNHFLEWSVRSPPRAACPIVATRHTGRWFARHPRGTAHRRGTRVAFSPSVTRSQGLL